MSEDKLESSDLKKVGLKVTLPRVKILSILERAPQRHISAEDVYKKLLESGDDVGLATVYRVLTQFETAGLVIRHHFESGHAVFELDGGTHHDHLVCMKCGLIEEFVDEVIEARQEAIAKQFGFSISEHCLYLYGTCQRCRSSTTF
jgi:Fur family transcriptional regulator, ferric uptake regulator